MQELHLPGVPGGVRVEEPPSAGTRLLAERLTLSNQLLRQVIEHLDLLLRIECGALDPKELRRRIECGALDPKELRRRIDEFDQQQQMMAEAAAAAQQRDEEKAEAEIAHEADAVVERDEGPDESA